ncbi:MlaD family protein [Nocardia bovistercoris]|uniref:MCE family protein n=1 Tax=Nocardia bovistercoris TaxID=2785916 RepID=A0A931IAY4_9NOCA|nr:MlaD family protein [Nocardia bovistercoris]MBH0778014.1 MCE family protein [Nocardia bovistercoris]
MTARSLFSLASVGLVLVLGVTYMTTNVLGIDPRRHYISVELRLDNSGGLGADAPVLLKGTRVGHVDAVRRHDRKVQVGLRIDSRYRIPVSSLVRIEQLSALGEPYVEFDPADDRGPYLEDGRTVSADRTRAPATITTLSVRMVELLDGIDPDAMAQLVGTFQRALAGTDAAMATLRRSAALLAATILSRKDSVRRMLADIQSMGTDIAWLGPSLAEAGPQFGRFGEALSTVIQSASEFIEARPTSDYFTGDGMVPFLDELTALVEELGPEVARTVPALLPTLTEAVAHTPAIDISDLIRQALLGVSDDGALRFRIAIK